MSMIFDRAEVSTDKSPVILWDNLFERASSSILASSEVTGGEKENALDGNTIDFWQPASLPAWLEVQTDDIAPLNYLGVAAHTLGTNNCTISIERYDYDTSAWVSLGSATPDNDKTMILATDLGLGGTVLVDDSGNVLLDDEGNALITTGKVRVYITGDSPPLIGSIFLGQGLRFDNGILPAYTPLYMAEEIELLNSQTSNGQFITNRVERRGAKSSFALNILDRSFVEGEEFQAFRRYYNDGKPFFFAGNPSELTDDVSYCWRQRGGELRPTFENNGIFYNANLSLEAYLGT